MFHNLMWEQQLISGALVPALIIIFSVAVDTTRVQIKEADPDVPGSDYINANYIRVIPLFAHNTCMSI